MMICTLAEAYRCPEASHRFRVLHTWTGKKDARRRKIYAPSIVDMRTFRPGRCREYVPTYSTVVEYDGSSIPSYDPRRSICPELAIHRQGARCITA